MEERAEGTERMGEENSQLKPKIEPESMREGGGRGAFVRNPRIIHDS